jgi:Ca-activated chloride channel family protein
MFSNLQHISFANKWVLWLIPVVVVLCVLWWLYRSKKQYATLRISGTASLASAQRPFRALLKNALPVLRALALILLLVAMARPQTQFDEEKINTEGIDIVLSMDVSASMLAKDFRPNRLESAKKVAMDFISERPHDRIGLVIFSGESFTQCPVTIDHAIVLNQLKQVRNGLLEDGTAIGMGLATAVQRLRELDSKSKVVILMTDGVNNKGLVDPKTAADLAMQFGVRVYTIGVGTNGMAMTPAYIQNGQIVFQNMPVQIDEEMLTDIAKKTGGQYFRATNDRKLRDIYEQINKLEKTKIEVSAYSRKTEKFFVFAFGAAVLLIIELLTRYLIVRSIP